jgi:uncharacterized protein with von Willebrand factor type A (vWA) domain
MTAPNPQNLSLEDAVTAFLQLASLPPEKPPKTQRAQRDNSMMILGFNQAQEALRTILGAHGANDDVRALAEVRSDGQQKPMVVGDRKVWVAGQ